MTRARSLSFSGEIKEGGKEVKRIERESREEDIFENSTKGRCEDEKFSTRKMDKSPRAWRTLGKTRWPRAINEPQ